jgi:lipopolysaccharide/colanic/teichoic acid biosynthesis glycosyltransferase
MKRNYLFVKYRIDFFLALIFVLSLSPILLIIALWIKLDSSGPVLFKQTRVGKDKKSFVIFKFRTMVVDAESKGKQLTVGNDPRITRCGRFLRAYKLDELPQLLNILRGDMSFIGPRPEVPQYVSLYNEMQLRVLSVRPGLSDEASIKYRNENLLLEEATNPEQLYLEKIMPDKIQLNLSYIQTISFKKDIQIMIKTIVAIFIKGQLPLKGRG